MIEPIGIASFAVASFAVAGADRPVRAAHVRVCDAYLMVLNW